MILIVASEFDKSNTGVVEQLLTGVEKVLNEKNKKYTIIRVPGANEIPCTFQHFFVHHTQYTLGVALGCVIKGDTDHYELVINACTTGLGQVSLQYQKPIIQGVLACKTSEQADARSHLGTEYGESALTMLQVLGL